MRFELLTKSRVAIAGALVLGATLAVSSFAQAPAGGGGGGGGGKSPAEAAIEARQAVYTLVSNQWGPIGGLLQGRGTYNQADVKKRADRLAFLANMAGDAFPDVSKTGETKAKPEIWTNRAVFDKKMKDFQDHTAALAQVAAKESTASEAFKTAAAAVGQDCKGCHDDFRAK